MDLAWILRRMNDLKGDVHLQNEAIDSLHGYVSCLSLYSEQGCRLVQRAIEIAPTDVAARLAAELHDHVQELMASSHGNYVVQKIVEILPPAHSSFVAEELRHCAAQFARDKYGCRILVRLVEYSLSSPATVLLIDEILVHACDLSFHQYGHLVLKTLLEHGTNRDKSQIASVLRDYSLWMWAGNVSLSYVIEAALLSCSEQDQLCLAKCLMSGNDDWLSGLAATHSGAHVLGALLTLLTKLCKVQEAHRIRLHLQQTVCGKMRLRKMKPTP